MSKKICEECEYPFKDLYRCKYEVFHKSWLYLCYNCVKMMEQVYGKNFIFGGNVKYYPSFFNVKSISKKEKTGKQRLVYIHHYSKVLISVIMKHFYGKLCGI